jgi:hypothetical protein
MGVRGRSDHVVPGVEIGGNGDPDFAVAGFHPRGVTVLLNR